MIWAVIGIALLLYFTRDKSIGLKDHVRSLFASKLVVVYLIATAYLVGVVLILQKLSIWELAQLKNTIVWFLFAGLPLTFSLVAKDEIDEGFLKRVAIQHFRFVVIIEYIVGLHSFSFLTEFILFPSLLGISLFVAFSEGKKDFQAVHGILLWILGGFVSWMLGYSLWQIFQNMDSLNGLQSLLDIITPLIMTVSFLPLALSLYVYAGYEKVFSRISFFIQDKKLARYAKFRSVLKFHFRIGLLNRWRRYLSGSNRNTKADIKNSFHTTFVMRDIEKVETDCIDSCGWPPAKALKFLENRGLGLGQISPLGDGRWWASPSNIELQNVLLSNRLSYNIEGEGRVAQKLTLTLDVNTMGDEKEALETLVQVGNELSLNALGYNMLREFSSVILSKKEHKKEIGGFSVSILHEPYVNLQGYSIKFTIMVAAFERDW